MHMRKVFAQKKREREKYITNENCLLGKWEKAMTKTIKAEELCHHHVDEDICEVVIVIVCCLALFFSLVLLPNLS
jgi:hypothetical protein